MTKIDGAFIGAGIGFGIFSSIFASAGLTLFTSTWIECFRAPSWGPGEIISTAFQSVFACPFMGAPMFLFFAWDNFMIPILGYGLPFVAFLLIRSGIRMSNPLNRQSNPSNVNTAASGPDTESLAMATTTTTIDSKWKNDAIYQWLSGIGLTEYHEILKGEGYETVSDLKTITARDLKELGITKQMHVKRILIKNGQGTASMREYEEGTNQGNNTGTNSMPLNNVWSDMPPAYAEGNGDQPPPDYNQATHQ